MGRRLGDDLPLLAALIASAAFLYLVPSLPLDAIGVLGFAILTWIRTDLALGAVLTFVPYFMHPKHIGHLSFAPSEILLVIVVAVVLLTWGWHVIVHRRLQGRERMPEASDRSERTSIWQPLWPCWQPLVRSPFILPAVVFFIGALISTYFAAERHLALREFREVIAEPLIFFGLLVLYVRPRVSDGQRLPAWTGWVLIVTGVFPSLIALGQFATHHDLVAVQGAPYERVKAWYGSPDNLGLLLDRTIPMWLALVFVPRGFERAVPPVSGAGEPPASSRRAMVVRVGLLLAGAVMLATLILTFSRGAWIAIGITALALLTVRFSWGRWLALAIAVVVLVGVAAELGRVERAFGAGHAGTVQRRIDIWHSSLNMVHAHPIFGVGPDNFIHYYAPAGGRYLPCAHGLGYMEPSASSEPCLSHPHNEVLDFWLSTGILGLAAFVWLEVVFWRLLWLQRDTLAHVPIVLGAGGAMLASLIHGLIDNAYFLIDLSMLFWYLVALMSMTIVSRAAPIEGLPGGGRPAPVTDA